MKELSRVASAVHTSTTLAVDSLAKKMKAEGYDVIGFGTGEPDFDTPDHIKEAAIEAIRRGETKYTPAAGILPLRRAISAFLQKELGVNFEWDSIVVTSGAKHCLFVAFYALLNPGDEVILPSFTFSSTATAFLLAGAKLVFVDIRPDTMNIDETKIEAAITDRTKVIVPVHYAGVACEMDTIMDIARRHNLMVVEDAAQGIMSTYKGRSLGTIGDFGCFSFHETKNYSMGEGGALLIRDPIYNERAEILREKGTDRSKFLRGQVDKYTWIDFGDSYLPSELNAAYLWGQLQAADEINNSRLTAWNTYYEQLKPLEEAGKLVLPTVPNDCVHNAHMFYVKCRDLEERTRFIQFLKEKGVMSVFHYVPLHSAPAGLKFGRFYGEDVYTTSGSERLARLPIYYGISETDVLTVCDAVKAFFRSE